MPKEVQPKEHKPAKAKEEKKVPREKEIVKRQVKETVKAVEPKKIKEKKVLKKIEDFNKFARLRIVKEAMKKKELSEKLVIDAPRILKAVKCLQTFQVEKKEKSKLLLEDEDEFFYIEITLSKLPEEYTIRPYQM